VTVHQVWRRVIIGIAIHGGVSLNILLSTETDLSDRGGFLKVGVVGAIRVVGDHGSRSEILDRGVRSWLQLLELRPYSIADLDFRSFGVESENVSKN
jgi:hypothetical protein